MVTARDSEADFQNYRTFFVRPEIRMIDEGREEGVETVPDLAAQPLIEATTQNLIDRGFRPAASKEEADLGVELVYLRAVYTATYCYDWYYWWDYYYWGYYYYYPYGSCDTAAWRSGMMVTHMTDLATMGPGPDVPPVATPLPSAVDMPPTGSIVEPPSTTATLRKGVWFSGIYGVEIDSASFIVSRAVDGIDQAFKQSPYLTTAAP
ncbi:MAG TPA: DUF4136 domain-containing protein [Polyangiaceae bacterium]|nr:DUF4136 domain-containing protein [Polyangiaceae bacterium]